MSCIKLTKMHLFINQWPKILVVITKWNYMYFQKKKIDAKNVL